MDNKVIELVKQAGFTSIMKKSEYLKESLERFYTLARADLEADLAATRDLAEGYAQERNELKAENAKLKQIYAMLASVWFYGGWKAETHNERLMQKLMQEAGYWPTTEEEIVARAALGETDGSNRTE